MGQSRSERQVLIFDCCFSGAFAKDMLAKGERTLDLQAQLGGTGRVVLTSSTEMQESFEEGGSSIYTRYLVEGLETGAADQNDDGKVTVDELHEYAKEKVREAAPSMQPEIYAVREGYKIIMARAPQGEPKLVYRKELNERAKKKRGRLSRTEQRALKFRCQELGLSPEEAEQIGREILQPYQIFWEKLDEFAEAVEEALEDDPQWTASTVDDLLFLQRILKLRDEDIAPVLQQHGITLVQEDRRKRIERYEEAFVAAIARKFPISESDRQALHHLQHLLDLSDDQVRHINQRIVDKLNQKEAYYHHTKIQEYAQQFVSFMEQGWPLSKPHRGALSQLKNELELHDKDVRTLEGQIVAQRLLESENGVDYTNLRELLAAGDWKGADNETYLRMLEVVGREEGDWIRDDELLNFPCADLKTIDRLWVHYSQGQFGFSAQKQIYVDCGAKLNSKHPGTKVWHKFCTRIGWRVNGSHISSDNIIFDNSAPKAHLPFQVVSLGYWVEGILGLWELMETRLYKSLLSHRNL